MEDVMSSPRDDWAEEYFQSETARWNADAAKSNAAAAKYNARAARSNAESAASKAFAVRVSVCAGCAMLTVTGGLLALALVAPESPAAALLRLLLSVLGISGL